MSRRAGGGVRRSARILASLPSLPSPLDLGWTSWADASDASYRTLDVTEVVQIQDKIVSGATWDRIGAGQGPTIDTATNIVTFNGTNQGLRTSNATIAGIYGVTGGSPPVTLAMVFRLVSHVSDGIFLCNSSTALTTGTAYGMRSNTTQVYKIQRRATAIITGPGGAVDTSWHVLTAVINGASSYLKVDGTTVVSGTISQADVALTHACIAHINTNTGDQRWANIAVKEWALYQGEASAVQLSGIDAYWRAKHSEV